MSPTRQEHKSAKIYQFPVGGRRMVGEEAKLPVASSAPPLVPVMSSSGWYHEAEMQTVDSNRKN